MGLNYPKGEIVWVEHHNANGNLRYITTSKSTRDYYYLYELADGKFVKIGKEKDPSVLERKYIHL